MNGSSAGMVRIELDPSAKAKVAGLTFRLRKLRISVDDPDDLIRSL